MEATFRHFQKPQDGKIKEFCIYDVSQKMAYLVKVDQLSDQKITPPIKEKVGGGGPLSFPVGYNKKTVLANSSRYRTYPHSWYTGKVDLGQCYQLFLHSYTFLMMGYF